MTSANTSYLTGSQLALRFKQALLLAAALGSLSFSATAQDILLKRASVTLDGATTAAADATSKYVFKSTTAKTANAAIPELNTITYSFPVGTLVQGTDPNNGGAAVNVTATFKNQQGGSTVPVALTPGTDPVTFGPTLTFTVPLGSGVAANKTFTTTFNGIVNPTLGGSKVASISAGNFGNTNDIGSVAYTITFAAASKLTFTQSPAAPVYSGRVMNVVTVAVQDKFGNTVTNSTASIAMAIGTNPVGGTFAGTTPITAQNGVATFSNLAITGVGTNYTLRATSGTLTAAVSNFFDVIVPIANKLVFGQQPTNTMAGVTIAPNVTVTVQDSFGTPVTGSQFLITLSTSQGAPVFGTTGVLTNSGTGTATFTNINIQLVGTYNLVASSSSASSVNSNSFVIGMNTIATPVLVFHKQPALQVVAGDATANYDSPILSAFQPDIALEVAIEDTFGNIRTDLDNKSIILGINPGPGGPIWGTLSSKTNFAGTQSPAAGHGIAVFDDVDISVVGSYTLKATDSLSAYTPGTS